MPRAPLLEWAHHRTASSLSLHELARPPRSSSPSSSHTFALSSANNGQRTFFATSDGAGEAFASLGTPYALEASSTRSLGSAGLASIVSSAGTLLFDQRHDGSIWHSVVATSEDRVEHAKDAPRAEWDAEVEAVDVPRELNFRDARRGRWVDGYKAYQGALGVLRRDFVTQTSLQTSLARRPGPRRPTRSLV